ncbi:unnamed protein product [Clonostachys rosea f. rosea IK726]|uniref:Uncharacterized protein n=2 Tax=Bionectria ochroleuca TaxID=29856 RepID=A0A0B7KPD4_BIOOC|nr:unnamed protein product [Clonostachys rosea f. rosea IK726]
MLPEPVPILLLTIATHILPAAAASSPDSPEGLARRNSNPLGINWAPAPAPEDGPPLSAGSLRNPAYLPAQIGGIVGAYAFSIVLVAGTLLALAKRRRERLTAAHEDFEPFEVPEDVRFQNSVELKEGLPVPNFSYPSPQKEDFDVEIRGQLRGSPTSSICGPGVNPFVDPNIVAADRVMAQNQLEQMYRHVMDHEDSKKRGAVTEVAIEPPTPSPRRERIKPASLNLSEAREAERPQSRTSSILSSFRSSKKKQVKGLNISSPMMTPQSATFPRITDPYAHEPSTPRYYAPPPMPTPREHVFPAVPGLARTSNVPVPPDQSPESVMSIDERLGLQLDRMNMNQGNPSSERVASQAYTEGEPVSAISRHSGHSQAPLVGLPSSPKATKTSFPPLPSSPKPGASFSRANAPSAVRTGGSLPLRAYEPSVGSPTSVTHSTKQTVFERKGPLSPGTARTPGTAMPYSPYQPFTPCVPVTPSLVTKEERKRMRKTMPKTPTMEMVKSSEEIW